MRGSSLIALGAAGVILALALSIGMAVLFVFMFIWNISDIQNVGVNFWNVFWLVIASLGSLSLIGSFFKS